MPRPPEVITPMILIAYYSTSCYKPAPTESVELADIRVCLLTVQALLAQVYNKIP